MVLIVALILACICFPSAGFSENQSAGFYAGPLSTAAETIVEAVDEKKDVHVN